MPKTYTILRVFVASPADVVEERSLVKQLIDEYNLVNKSLDVRLELVGWEQDVTPNLGADPQAVINDQIGNDYDIFVGILWTRFGTVTPRASSGTKEEFDRAYKRFQKAPNTLRIMIYFSERPTNPAGLDATQIGLVNAFREELGDKGIYGTYKSLEDFESRVRIHLSRHAQEWGKTWGTSEDRPPQVVTTLPDTVSEPARELSRDADEGLLDLVLRGKEEMAEATNVITRIGESIKDLGKSLVTRTAEMKAASGSKDTRLAKRLVDRAADDMLTFADQVDSDIPQFADSYGAALDAFGHSAVLLPELGPADAEPVRESRDAVRTVIESLQSGKASVEALEAKVSAIPPMSTNMNRAKTRVVRSLETLAAEWGRAIDASSDVEGLYDLVLQEIDD